MKQSEPSTPSLVGYCHERQPGAKRIEEVLRTEKKEVLIFLSKPIVVGDSNEAYVLAILKALRIYSGSFLEKLIVKSDSSNAIAWVLQKATFP